MVRPLTYKIFKGVTGKWGAINFSFQSPHYYCNECKSKTWGSPADLEHKVDCNSKSKTLDAREGCVFVELASATGPNVYDWDNKIVMALSVNDMSQLLFGLRTGENVKLMHDPGAKSDKQGAVQKYLQFESPNGVMEGGFLTLRMTSNGETKQHKVPLSGHEVLALATLLTSALSASMGW